MRADYRVFIDACVLADFGVCDLLLRLSEGPRLMVPRWSHDVLDEVRRTQTEKLNWPPELVESFQKEIRIAFPDAVITAYDDLLAAAGNDPKDRHVLAAAVRGGCPLILTYNLKDFPDQALAKWSVKATHPQDYLLVLYEMEPTRVVRCLGEIAGRRRLELEDVLIRLGRTLPCFSERLLDDLGR